MQKAACISDHRESVELTIRRRSQLQQLLSTAIQFFIHLVTLPYYRFFQFNTTKPIFRLAVCASNPNQSSKLIYLIAHWRTRKLAELQFISIAVRYPFFSALILQIFFVDILHILVRSTCHRRHRIILLDRHPQRLLGFVSVLVLQPRALDPWDPCCGPANRCTHPLRRAQSK